LDTYTLLPADSTLSIERKIQNLLNKCKVTHQRKIKEKLVRFQVLMAVSTKMTVIFRKNLYHITTP
jgi:uncharacterized protein YjcR